jgi:hypothetical protein
MRSLMDFDLCVDSSCEEKRMGKRKRIGRGLFDVVSSSLRTNGRTTFVRSFVRSFVRLPVKSYRLYRISSIVDPVSLCLVQEDIKSLRKISSPSLSRKEIQTCPLTRMLDPPNRRDRSKFPFPDNQSVDLPYRAWYSIPVQCAVVK